MSNPFSVLEELSSPTKVQKKAPAKKKASTKKDNKKNTKAETKQTPTPSLNANAQKRKPKRLIPEENASTTATSETTSETPVEKKEEKKSAPRDRNFDGPDNLKNYKRDGNKAYFNRKPGQAPVKGGKRYEQKDRSVNRTGKKFQRYGPKGGEGGKGNWYGKVDNPSRYLKKKPQEMNDEEWDKLMKVDEQKQKKDAQRGQKRKPVKKVEKKTEESKDKTDAVVATESSEKKPFKKDGDKKRPFKKDGERRKPFKKDFKKKPFKKDFKKKPFKKDDDGIVLPEVAEDESDDEGKETYEDFIKARKKPVTLNDSQERKAGEGVKIAKQKEFVRNLDRSNQTYMKVSKKKPAKKEKKEEASTEPKTEDAKVKVQKKKKKKVLSTTEFFKGSDVPKKSGFKNKKAGNKKTGNKKNVPDFKDSQSFPSLS